MFYSFFKERVGGARSFVCIEVNVLNKKIRGKNIVSSVWNLVEPIAHNLNLNIWDIQFLKEGLHHYLRIFIDSENGITVEDCEKFSRAIDKPLDELDPISQNYLLEVCSPGINRCLTRDEHLKKFIGHKIIVRFIRPVNKNIKQINGRLLSFDENILSIHSEDEMERLDILRKNIAFIKLDDF